MKLTAVYERCGCSPTARSAVARDRFGRAPVAHDRGIERQSHRHGAREAAPAGSACRPYMKVERDMRKFRACQAIADRIGPIDTSEKAYEVLKEAAGHEVAERFGVVCLDTHMKLRDIAETGAGETSAVMAPMVPTLQAAVASGCEYIIAYHVHPAASERPSDADVEVTKSFAKAFKTIGLTMVDHLVIAPGGKKGFYSFAESNPKALKV